MRLLRGSRRVLMVVMMSVIGSLFFKVCDVTGYRCKVNAGVLYHQVNRVNFDNFRKIFCVAASNRLVWRMLRFSFFCEPGNRAGVRRDGIAITSPLTRLMWVGGGCSPSSLRSHGVSDDIAPHGALHPQRPTQRLRAS